MAIYSGITHWKLWFSIVVLVYQRVMIYMWIMWCLCSMIYHSNHPYWVEVTMADILIIWWSFHDFLHPFLIGIAMEIVPWQSQALDALEDFNRSPEETKRAAQAPMSLRFLKLGRLLIWNETQLIGFRWWFIGLLLRVATLDAYIVLATLVTQPQVVKDMLLSSSAEPQVYLGITWYIRYITLLSPD